MSHMVGGNRLPLLYTLLSILLLLVLLSYLIAVPSKLFLFQPVNFAFHASNSPLQPVTGGASTWSVSVGTRTWGIPFLNHDTFKDF